MKFIEKTQQIELEVGDVVECINSSGKKVRYIVIRAWDTNGLCGYGLVDLDNSEQLPQLFDDMGEVIKEFVSLSHRIIKSVNLELREV